MKHWWKNYSGTYLSMVRLGIPILVSQLGMIVVGFADNIMVGRYSTDALASASFVNNLFNMAIFASLGFTYGLTPLIGAMFSQKRFDAIGSILRNGVALNMLFSLFVTTVMAVVYFNVERMGQPEHLLPLIKPYFLTYLAGLITISLFNVFAQWAYAIKRTQMPMWIILASNLVNILGNYLLIYGKCGLPEMGLLGAGCSTLLARAICPVAIICVFLFHKGFRPYRTGFSKARLSGTELKRIFSTSLPVSLQMTFETGSFALTVVMAGWLGALSLAALQVILIISMLGFCVYYSIGVSISVLVANACGLGDGRLMRHTAFAGYHLILFLTVVASTVFLLLGGAMIRAFTTDMAVISLASTLIFPLVLYQLGDATQITFANALRGTSNVMPMLWISFFCYLVIGIPAAYLLAFTANLGVYGIILSYAAGLFPAAGLYLFFFLRSTAPRRE